MENVGASMEDEENEEMYIGESDQNEQGEMAVAPTLFKQVVDSLKPSQSLSSCIINTQGGGSQSGGANSVSVDKITILIMLAHGLINLTPTQVALEHPHPTINVSALQNVKNLAIFGFAPTGMVNIGNLQELTTYGDMIQNEFIAMIQSTVNSSIQSIEDKIKNNREKLEVIRAPRKIPKEGILTRICNICFKAWVSLPSISETVDNYTFKNFLSVCRNILPSTIFSSSKSIMDGGVKHVVVKRADVKQGVAKPITTSKSHSTGQTFSLGQPFSMSNDMCVLLLDDLRSSIQNFDRVRFPLICEALKGQDFCDAAMANCMERCRKLYIVKGFGSGQLPFVNKHFQYNTVADGPLNMGVIKLKFSIDSSGNVNSNPKLYKPEVLMLKTGLVDPANPTSFWCSMQDWIQLCTDHGDETVCVVDLSCSGIVCEKQTLVELPRNVQSPGGGGVIKKKSYSRKKSRKNSKPKSIRKRSRRIKHVRNRRNIRKNYNIYENKQCHPQPVNTFRIHNTINKIRIFIHHIYQ